MTKSKNAFIHVTYSPHDGGWYAEVFGSDGKTLHETKVFRTSKDASENASRWCTSKSLTVIKFG